MKQDYWNVSDEQVMEKTGRNITDWIKVLDSFQALDKKSKDVVAYLQGEHNVPKYWARTLTTLYTKQKQQ
jgi:alkyl hydroperoxide reductase subunit AhpC